MSHFQADNFHAFASLKINVDCLLQDLYGNTIFSKPIKFWNIYLFRILQEGDLAEDQREDSSAGSGRLERFGRYVSLLLWLYT